MKIVLQKFIANSGFCSRRNAENLIREGKVLVNGKLAELGMRVDKNDEVKVGSDKIYLSEKKIYIKLNKPIGYTCTNKKFIGEKNIFILVRLKEKLYSVGRLDKNSRGLVLLTNDGELTQKLTHPKFGHEKKYMVTIKSGRLNLDDIMKKFKQGVDIGNGDGVVRVKEIKYLNDDKLEITLTEGKKRQIRRMFKEVNCEVIDLVRIKIGSLELGNLKEKEWKYLSNSEIKSLKLGSQN